MSVFQVPEGCVLMGTCGACGGPLLASQFIMADNTCNQEPPIQCAYCGRMAKPSYPAQYGPIKEMLP